LTAAAKNEVLDVTVSLGEFDPSVDGAYRNVKTFPLAVSPGELFVSVTSDRPVDIAITSADGICLKFKDSILCDTLGPIEVSKKGTMALIAGVFRGDRAELRVRAWMG
jgi:hypothetical protein